LNRRPSVADRAKALAAGPPSSRMRLCHPRSARSLTAARSCPTLGIASAEPAEPGCWEAAAMCSRLRLWAWSRASDVTTVSASR
jgi:hypothetical protein